MTLFCLVRITYMGGGPTLMFAAEAVRAYEEFREAGAKAPA